MIVYSETVIYVTECYGEMNISDVVVADCTVSGKFFLFKAGGTRNMYKFIQVVAGGMFQTSGECSLC
jgi:hypothetical protein